MIRILGTIFAGLLGLAFGSFLNVCLSRWPEGESVVAPRSHCRNCTHTLSWWENIPLFSWVALRGRCRNCHAWIGVRYPLVELVVGALWAVSAWSAIPIDTDPSLPLAVVAYVLANAIAQMIFSWFLVALAVLDAENLWLPDALTLPGIALGLMVTVAQAEYHWHSALRMFDTSAPPLMAFLARLIGAALAAALILLIRWVYWLIRRREGIGLGDAKLMALLAAWLGLPGALFSFGLGVVLGALVAVVLLAIPSTRNQPDGWAASKLPLGTFLCVGGIVSGLWGQQIIAAYMRWAGF
jgi:leader peptidase (prepilin peptidase)/N-methyltransferase